MCKSESFLIGNYVGEHQIPTLLLFRLNAMSYGSLPQGQKERTLSPSRLGTAGMAPSEQTRNITLSVPHGVRRSDSLPFILLPLFRVVCFHRFTFFIQVPLSLLLPLAAVVWGPFCYSRALSHGPPRFSACPFLARSKSYHVFSAVLCPFCGFSFPVEFRSTGLSVFLSDASVCASLGFLCFCCAPLCVWVGSAVLVLLFWLVLAPLPVSCCFPSLRG